jgi:mRNA interferase HigB
MNVIAKSALVEFWNRQPAGLPQKTARAAMMEWYTTASDARWDHFDDLKKTFNSADYVADGKVVFDIGGN